MAATQSIPATGTATVSVACKIPQGMRCVLHAPREVKEVTLGGFREVTQHFPTDREFIVKGPAHAQNEGPRCRVVAGFAITEGVSKELWDEWRKQFASLDAVQKNHIFAYETPGKIEDAAKDHQTVKTGLERLNPHALPQLDKRFKLQTADDAVAQIGSVDG